MWLEYLSLASRSHKHLLRARFTNLNSVRHSSRCRLPQHLAYLEELPNDDEYFRYTSGRWLYNETLRLEERRLHFDVPALLHVAAASVDRDVSSVVAFNKIAEGGFNRVFRIVMEDGFSLLARMPYASTQPKQLATASEVATMTFLRHHDIPVPDIYDYNTRADNGVGTEYILMQDLQGQALGRRWFDIDAKQRIKVLSEIVDVEAKLFSVEFPAFGSIYYQEDLPHTFDRKSFPCGTSKKKFCIGPDVSMKHWFRTREDLTLERGSAASAQDVLVAGAMKELEWLQAYGKPRFPFDRVHRDITNFQQSDPQEHITSLQTYMQVARQLIPEAQWLHRPILRHPDLNANNIFVNDALEITGLIDWQHSCILPLFLNAGLPSHFQNHGDPVSDSLTQPELPNLQELDEDEKLRDMELYRRRHVPFFYLGATSKQNSIHFDAMTQEIELFRKRLYQHASEPWEGNSIPLATHLALLPLHWERLTGTSTCPLTIDETVTEKLVTSLEKQEEADNDIAILRNSLGISEDGWVSHDDYDHARSEAAQFKAQAISMADDDHEREMTIRHWPFEDHDEDE